MAGVVSVIDPGSLDLPVFVRRRDGFYLHSGVSVEHSPLALHVSTTAGQV